MSAGEMIAWTLLRLFFHTVYLNSKACVIASPAREMKYFNCQNLAVS